MFKFGRSLGDANTLITCVSSNDFKVTKNFIESRQITSAQLNSIEDYHCNNLLHIAVMTENNEMVTFFLEKGISFIKQNKFKHSPWDLAVMSKDSKIIESFVSYRTGMVNTNTNKVIELSSENSLLKTVNKDLKNQIKYFEIHSNLANEKLCEKVNVLESENKQLKTSNKRLREELCDLQSDNKKLRDENVGLVNKNEKLKASIETLMNNSKK